MDQTLNEIAAYWTLRSQGYSLDTVDELNAKDGSFYASALSLEISNHAFFETKKALDLGCGPGFFSILLAQMGFDVTAVDISDGMLQKAKNLAVTRNLKIDFIKADVQNPPFASESFDIIVSRNVFWNLPNLENAYKNALKLLKKSGLLLIFDGNHYYYYIDPEYKSNPYVTHRHLENIDVSVIDTIAAKLPASYKLRPAYDLQILQAIKGINASAQVLKRHEKNGKEIIDAFLVHAIKE